MLNFSPWKRLKFSPETFHKMFFLYREKFSINLKMLLCCVKHINMLAFSIYTINMSKYVHICMYDHYLWSERPLQQINGAYAATVASSATYSL